MQSLEADVSAHKLYRIRCVPCVWLFIVSPKLKVPSCTLKFRLTCKLIRVSTAWAWLVPASAIKGYFLYLKKPKTHCETLRPIKFSTIYS